MIPAAAAAGRGYPSVLSETCDWKLPNLHTQRTTICARGSFMVYPGRYRRVAAPPSHYHPPATLGVCLGGTWAIGTGRGAPVFRLVMGARWGPRGGKFSGPYFFFNIMSCAENISQNMFAYPPVAQPLLFPIPIWIYLCIYHIRIQAPAHLVPNFSSSSGS